MHLQGHINDLIALKVDDGGLLGYHQNYARIGAPVYRTLHGGLKTQKRQHHYVERLATSQSSKNDA